MCVLITLTNMEYSIFNSTIMRDAKRIIPVPRFDADLKIPIDPFFIIENESKSLNIKILNMNKKIKALDTITYYDKYLKNKKYKKCYVDSTYLDLMKKYFITDNIDNVKYMANISQIKNERDDWVALNIEAVKTSFTLPYLVEFNFMIS